MVIAQILAACLAAEPAPLDAVKRRLDEVLRAGTLSRAELRGSKIFYLKRRGLDQQAALYVREGGEPRLVVDPNPWSPDGTTGLAGYFPSHDGLLVAYAVEAKGERVLRVREVDSALDLPDRVPRAGAGAAWLADRTGFFYEAARPGGRTVLFHRLGTDPRRDETVFGPGEGFGVRTSADGRWLLVTARRSAGATDLYARDLARRATDFLAIVRGMDSLYEGRFGPGDSLYVRTNEGAPNFRVMAVDLENPKRHHWREIVKEGPLVLAGLEVLSGHLALSLRERGYSRLRLHDLKGKPVRELPLPLLGSVSSLGAHEGSASAAFVFESFTSPPELRRWRPGAGSAELLEAAQAPDGLEDLATRLVSYKSLDGTPISMLLVHHKRLRRDRRNPALLAGRGAFGETAAPEWTPALIPWLERGGLYAAPHLRGGGEYGEEWHRAGMRERKQNTFDDFLAAARWLVEQEYTAPELLAAADLSGGNVLGAAALAQAPELFEAALLVSPLADMLDLGPADRAEYGSPDDPGEAAWLTAYSPLAAVRGGTRYPAVLIQTPGPPDGHAVRLAAALKAVGGRAEILPAPGPRGPLDAAREDWAGRYAFLYSRMGFIDRDP